MANNKFSILADECEVPIINNESKEIEKKYRSFQPTSSSSTTNNDWSDEKKKYIKPRIRLQTHTNEIKVIDDSDKKKITRIVPKCVDASIPSPEYYNKRSLNTKYEIPQCKEQFTWIKKVGGLEKSTTIEKLIKGILISALSFFEDKTYMMSNTYFCDKISLDHNKQEEVLEFICMNTTAIVLHRYVKSDNSVYCKKILENIPSYRLSHNNDIENSQYKNTVGANALLRIKDRWIYNNYIIANKTTHTSDEISSAEDYINKVETTWRDYLVQSIWNCNNIIHTIIWNASISSFKFFSLYCYEFSMYKELAYMLEISNNNNPPESINDIITRGEELSKLESIKNQDSSYFYKKINYEECRKLIKTLLVDLKDKINSIDNSTYGDNANVCDLIINGDISGMINHIKKCYADKEFEIIKKTLELWESTVESDTTGNLIFYLLDVKFHIKDLIL